MKKKIILGLAIALVIAFAVVLFACVGKKKDKERESEEIIIEEGSEEEALSGIAEGETASGEEEGAEELPVLTEEEAAALLNEKLEGLSCEAVYNDETTIDGTTYYTYTVLNGDEEEIDQMLAVSGFSGEVFVYDLLKNKVSDYSEFTYFDASRDEPVNWEGSFTNGKLKCTLEPSSENMFEFKLSGGKELVGVAAATGNEAEYSDDSCKLKFTMNGKKLKVEDVAGDSGYAGTYSK